MRVLVTGASGFAGAALVGPLVAAGHEVRAFGRSAARIEAAGVRPTEVVVGDATSGRGLRAAVEGVELAYYLIHAMEPGPGAFDDREQRAAEHFAAAATRAGVRRIVYLGTPLPAGASSPHLVSRDRVARALIGAAPELVTLRAAIAIGARSRSFRLLVRLIERLPVLPLPTWRERRTRPIDQRDLISYLVRAGTVSGIDGTLDLEVGGPEVVSYGELIERICDRLLLWRPTLPLPWDLTPVAAALTAAIAGERIELVEPLMSGLGGDLLGDTETARERLGVRLHSLDAAIEHALGGMEGGPE